jgi:hypothetical protein
MGLLNKCELLSVAWARNSLLCPFQEKIIIIIITITIIIIGKDTISFIQGMCTYIPETNHVPKKYNVATILSLLFMVTISLAPALALLLLLLLL